MAIIEKDGFDFIDDVYGNPEALIVKGLNLNEEVRYINENNIKSVYLTYFKSKAITDLDFFKETSFIEKINLNDMDIDYSGLYHLHNLKHALLSIKNKRQYLDYSIFKNLEYLSIDWYTQFPDFTKNVKLKKLAISKFKPKSKSFIELKLPDRLQNLEITESNVLDFNGLELANLIKFEGYYCNCLQSFEGIKGIKKSLKTLILDYCPKLKDYDDLEQLKQIEKLILGDCGEISDLEFISKMPNLNFFSFVNTNVKNGNLKLLKQKKFSYLAFDDKRHYSNKLKEFR